MTILKRLALFVYIALALYLLVGFERLRAEFKRIWEIP